MHEYPWGCGFSLLTSKEFAGGKNDCVEFQPLFSLKAAIDVSLLIAVRTYISHHLFFLSFRHQELKRKFF